MVGSECNEKSKTPNNWRPEPYVRDWLELVSTLDSSKERSCDEGYTNKNLQDVSKYILVTKIGCSAYKLKIIVPIFGHRQCCPFEETYEVERA